MFVDGRSVSGILMAFNEVIVFGIRLLQVFPIHIDLFGGNLCPIQTGELFIINVIGESSGWDFRYY
jgi:hypothetical protein